MERVIYKYPIEIEDHPQVSMPKDSDVLCVQVQNGTPCIWALVNPDAPIETRTFRIFGTGHLVDLDPLESHYIGTFQLRGGGFIGHLFEEGR